MQDNRQTKHIRMVHLVLNFCRLALLVERHNDNSAAVTPNHICLCGQHAENNHIWKRRAWHEMDLCDEVVLALLEAD